MFAATDRVVQQQCPPVPIMDTDGRWRAHIQRAPNCPRCASTNTKFCYYNNYSLAQPRYFCKACRRYWTKGGSLRNVPVGGGCSKTRRSRSKAGTSSSSTDNNTLHRADDSSSLSGAGAAEIDLAAVFARYVRQDSGAPRNSVSEGEAIETLDPRQVAVGEEWEGQGNDTMGLVGDLESLDHGLLSQMDRDVLWSTSEDGSSLSSGFPAWDPMDSLPMGLYESNLDEQFCSPSTNSFLSDINWSCFDMGGYGDF